MVPEQPPAAHTPAYETATLTTCDREPIHIPGAIQPHGVLLALDLDFRIVVASQNVQSALGVPVEELIGRELAHAIGTVAAASVVAAIDEEDLTEPIHLVLPDDVRRGTRLGVLVDLVLHRSGERIVVEIEPEDFVTQRRVTYRSARAAMSRLTETQTIAELCDRLAIEVRELTGFDRVMVYRFDEEWNGEVVAEQKRDDLNTFLGLHYPATDIPAQARRLYTANWTRLIADIGYAPVALDPVLDPGTGAPLDLSFSALRSVSPIHLEYLSNMGVTASMSVSMVRDGELWGLVACHHYSGPHHVPHDVRSMAEFLGQTASQLIDERERSDSRVEELYLQAVLAGITARLAADGRPPLEALIDDPALLELVGADGAALWDDSGLHAVGDISRDEALLKRVVALTRRDDDGLVQASSRLARLAPELAEVEDAPAGALLVTMAGGWLLFTRNELVEVVTWGGDPRNKELALAENPEVRLSPRKSFEKWRGAVRGRSASWSAWHLETADRLRQLLEAKIVRRSREQIAIAESLQRTIVLDEAPEVEGLSVFARYRPAEGQQLGGDWWDEIVLRDGRTAFVIGDVAGHGFTAATAMAQIRTALRAYLDDAGSPAVALDKLDRLMGSLVPGRTATALIAIFDARDLTLELASAGHPGPIRVHGGVARQIDVEPRPLLGIGVDGGVSTRLQLGSEDIVLMFTDGLVERRQVPIDESLEILRQASEGGPRTAPLPQWADALVEAVPGTLDDDTTLVVLRID